MHQTLSRCLTAALGALVLFPAPSQAGANFIELSVGMYRIEAEIAADPERRATGLMHREAMPTLNGMLFVFPFLATHCMWMRNTLLPLSVAFLDEDGRVINIAEMKPKTEDNHCAARPARYALEMNTGWFARRSISPGMKITGLERAPQPR